MDILGKLVIVTLFILLTISLLPIYVQNIVNNTANTIENTAGNIERSVWITYIKDTNELEGIDYTELLNQVGEAAKKIVIGSAKFYLILAVRLKKVLNKGDDCN